MEEDQAKQALARLASIEQKVKQVQDKLDQRLPSRRVHLAALACSTKWRLQTQIKREDDSMSEEEAQAVAKRVRTELGAFDYQVKEQAELLTRYLCELDDILSYGNAEVKDARKVLVVFIQSLFAPADAMKAKSAKLKQLGERLLEDFLPSLTPPATPVPEQQTTEAAEEEEDEEEEMQDDDEEEDTAEPMVDSKLEDQDMEESKEDADEEDDDDEEEEEEEEEEAMDDEEDSEVPAPAAPTRPMMAAPAPPASRMQIDLSSLPVWRPYYQLQRRPDGIYLLAKLHGIDQRNVRVQWAEQAGVLRISGFKLPTQKDLMVSRFSGTPTFGRFEITERFPSNVLNMDEATQHLREDGTLEIHMPYYYVQQPMRRMPQRTWFQPRDCFVW